MNISTSDRRPEKTAQGSSTNIITVNKLKIRLPGNLTGKGERRHDYKVLDDVEETDHLDDLSTDEYNIKMDVKDKECEGIDRFHLVQNRGNSRIRQHRFGRVRLSGMLGCVAANLTF